MSIETAKAHYIGKSGYYKLNCAQTVAHAFKNKYKISEATIEKLAGCGGGRAPDGICGALYAAKIVLDQFCPESVKDCEQALLAKAGSIRCKDIRTLNKLSCVGCVEAVATHIEKL